MKKLFRENWRVQWMLLSVVYFITLLLFKYFFNAEHAFTAPRLLHKAVDAIVFGLIFSLLMSPVNPFRKKQKKTPDAEKAG